MRLIDADKLKEELSYKSPAQDFDMDSVILGVIDEQPTVNPWHRVEEPPKEDGWYMLGFLSRWRDGNWWIPKFPDYWMTAEPPEEDAYGNT